MNWRPDENALKQVMNLLRLCCRGENLVQTEARNKVSQFREHFPQFNHYLVFILVKGGNRLRPDIRQLAGVLLKNNFRTLYMQNPTNPSLTYIKRMLVEGLCDPIEIIRVTVGSAISWFINYHQLASWPEIIPTLTRLLQSQRATPLAQAGIVKCLKLIVQDNHRDLDELRDRQTGNTPLNLLIPLFVRLFRHQNPAIRKDAISSIILLIDQSVLPNAFVANIQPFMTGLTELAKDGNPSIRKYVCRTFVTLTRHPQYLEPIIKQVVPFFVACGSPPPNQPEHPNTQKLKFEACEFWNRICYCKNKEVFLQHMLPYLPRIIPSIISGMVYSEFDRDYIESEVKREDQVSTAPRHSVNTLRANEQQQSGVIMMQGRIGLQNDDEFIDRDGEFMFGNYDLGEEWNLRRCSSHAIDVLAREFKGKVLVVAINEIQRRMQTNNCWWIRESGVLALGAICKGCLPLFSRHSETPKMINYLHQILERDQSPLVTSITLWTLGRFSPFVMMNQQVLGKSMSLILKKVVSRNMHVQDSACSCLSVFADEARERLTPMMVGIVQSLGQALRLYGRKNLQTLYDTIGSVASGLGGRINHPSFFELVLKPVFGRLEKHVKEKNLDDILISINECISNVIVAIKIESKKFAPYLWNLCMQLVKGTFEVISSAKMRNEFPPNKDIIVSCLDVMNQIVEYLGPGSQQLITYPFLGMLMVCLKEKNTSIRTCAFGMVGDLAKSCFGRITGVLDEIVQVLIANLGQNFPEERLTFPVLNNALWALGRIALQGGPGMVKYLSPICRQLTILIRAGRTLKEEIKVNLVVTSSRLSLSYPQQVSEWFPRFSREFCVFLPFVKDQEERRHAFEGLCIMLMKKSGTPEGNQMIQNLFPYVMQAISYYERPAPPPDLRQKLTKIMTAYRNAFGQNWERHYSNVSINSRNKLRENYNFP